MYYEQRNSLIRGTFFLTYLVIRESSVSHPRVIRQSLASHQAVIFMYLVLSATVLHKSSLGIHWFWTKALKLRGFWKIKITLVHRYKPHEARFWAARFFSGTKKPGISRPCCISLRLLINSFCFLILSCTEIEFDLQKPFLWPKYECSGTPWEENEIGRNL